MAKQTTRSGGARGGESGSASARKTGARSSARAAGASTKTAGKTRTSAGAGAAAKSGRGAASRKGSGKDLGDLFLETLKDMYHAEKQLIRALPKMAKAAKSPDLRQAFEKHAKETERHAERLERIFEMSGKRAQTKPCHGMMGLVEEGSEVMKEFKGSDAIDAGLIAAAQAVEHYEISRYGTLSAWASGHGMRDVVKLLEETLAEEKRTDQLLTQIAESAANPKAA